VAIVVLLIFAFAFIVLFVGEAVFQAWLHPDALNPAIVLSNSFHATGFAGVFYWMKSVYDEFKD
jgi:hypothetical protein